MTTTTTAADDGASGSQRPRVRLGDRDGALAWLFLLPSVVYIVALVGIPFFLAIGFALSDVTAGDPSFDWVGATSGGRSTTRCSGGRRTRSCTRPSRWC